MAQTSDVPGRNEALSSGRGHSTGTESAGSGGGPRPSVDGRVRWERERWLGVSPPAAGGEASRGCPSPPSPGPVAVGPRECGSPEGRFAGPRGGASAAAPGAAGGSTQSGGSRLFLSPEKQASGPLTGELQEDGQGRGGSRGSCQVLRGVERRGREVGLATLVLAREDRRGRRIEILLEVFLTEAGIYAAILRTPD